MNDKEAMAVGREGGKREGRKAEMESRSKRNKS